MLEDSAKKPLVEPKKRADGAMKRLQLINRHFGPGAWRSVREHFRDVWMAIVSDDDISDAFAALWTAERIHLGTAGQIPDPPEVDGQGLPMTMWF
jgi:predicted RNase H-like nuclease